MAQPELHSTADVNGLMEKVRFAWCASVCTSLLALQCLQQAVPLHEWRDW